MPTTRWPVYADSATVRPDPALAGLRRLRFGRYMPVADRHTTAEIAAVLQSLPVSDVRFSFGVFLPGGSAVARATERALPSILPMGAFMTVAGLVRHP